MKTYIRLLNPIKPAVRLAALMLLMLGALTGCHDIKEYSEDPRSTFEQLWTILDEHYCFFGQKDVDWNEVYARYAPQVADNMTDEELFEVCSRMLDELRDGHTNLSTSTTAPPAALTTAFSRRTWATCTTVPSALP